MMNLLSSSVTPATKATYRRAYKNFLHFHNMYYPHKNLFPILPLHMAHFIAHSFQLGLKGTSIQTQVAGINYMHRMMVYGNLTDNFILKKVLKATQKITRSNDKRKPITIKILKAFSKALVLTVLSLYDRKMLNTMYLVAFFALLRVGEITATQFGSHNILQYKDVQFSNTKDDRTNLTLNIQQHKHSVGTPLPIILSSQSDILVCPVQALSKYMSIKGSRPGPLFITSEGLPVQSHHFTAILKECIRSLGLNPQHYTSHGFRIGGASYAHQHNFSDAQLKRLGRWNSSAYIKYIRCPALAPNNKT